MNKILIMLYTIIFFLIVSINVISIKKFFDIKQVNRMNDIVATNYVKSLVSFNEIENKNIVVELIEENIIKKEILEEDKEIENKVSEIVEENNEKVVEENHKNEQEISNNEDVNSDILFDGFTEQELINKLEKSLKNELSGTAVNFVDYYKKTGLDPYLAVAIVLHETGCNWTCSSLVRECYNYGGMKGGEVKYKDTKYTCYSSKEEGINAYLNMLYNNYYAKGLVTAELINPKYATSLEWASKINNYIEKIKNK